MTKYKIIQNLKTGKDEFSFNAILFEVGENVIKNSNDKDYKIVTLGFQLPSGDEVKRTAICYEANYNYGFEVSKDYLSKLSFDANCTVV